eukprot:TRINITY_DN740_c0_g1_i1.p1 TRINITY_DN740_c0_g1~~TRINITY_DN740_c0_g1_i1.p1  ORF type:complete len:583 (-),score=85.14 TRINITY_DN740_c0_g1_i1:32-1780(-)
MRSPHREQVLAEARASCYIRPEDEWKTCRGSSSEFCKVQLLQQTAETYRILAFHEGLGEVAMNVSLTAETRYTPISQYFYVLVTGNEEFGINFVSKSSQTKDGSKDAKSFSTAVRNVLEILQSIGNHKEKRKREEKDLNDPYAQIARKKRCTDLRRTVHIVQLEPFDNESIEYLNSPTEKSNLLSPKTYNFSRSPIDPKLEISSPLTYRSTPPKSPTPIDISAKRSKLVQEILQTERHYFHSLTILRELYYLPLKALPRLEILNVINTQQLESIFCGFEPIYTVNKELLYALENHSKELNSNFGSIFLKFAPGLHLYSSYINGYDNAIKTIEKCKSESKIFDQFLSNTSRDPICQRKQITDFLITPIQRIPRYQLLLEELLKYTDTNHPDRSNLVSCLQQIKHIATVINDKRGDYHSQEMVSRVQAKFCKKTEPLLKEDRRFIMEGIFWVRNLDFKTPSKVLKKKKKEPNNEEIGLQLCTLVLFNDLVIWGVTEKKSSLLMQRGRVKLIDLSSFQTSPSYSVPFSTIPNELFGFSLCCDQKVLEVFYTTAHENINLWLNALNTQVKLQAQNKVRELERKHLI